LEALRNEDRAFEAPLNPADPDQLGRFKFFCRFRGQDLQPWVADDRLDARRLRRAGFEDILLAAFHYIDPRNNSPEKQREGLSRYKQTLLEAERKAGHTRTVLFGDLNMNPFAIGMLEPRRGLGAMITWDLAEAHSELADGGPHRFYNPMWSVMGRADAPGSYYWKETEPKNPYWNCIDAVLLRPEMRGVFVDDSLRILSCIPDSTGTEVALYRKAEKHWQILYFDHLPILFDLILPQSQEHNHARP
jgi:hypothetical protein